MKKGFTLVEMLTVIFLATLIIIGAYSVYLISYKAYQRNSASSGLTQNARIALERMTRDIRQAVEILTALPEDPSAGIPSSELKFQDGHNFWPAGMPSPSPSPSTPVGKIQYIRYYLSGTDLHRQTTHYAFASSPDEWVLYSTLNQGGASPTEYTDLDQVKAENITSLKFWGEATITIDIESSNGTSTYPFRTEVLGRNVQ